MPFTCHVTAVFVVFVTMAVNGCVFVTAIDMVIGEIVIARAGGSCVEEELDAQPCSKKTEINGRMKKNGTGRNSGKRIKIFNGLSDKF
jgi:hypothetical protein